MADNDGDSHMASSPEVSDGEDLQTPIHQLVASTSSILSPPHSEPHESNTSTTAASTTTMPTAALNLAGANANGKRPLNTISNGADETFVDMTGEDDDDGNSASAGRSGGAVSKVQDFPPRTHQPSGYTWTKIEAEPGYAWLSKKAIDEQNRAWDGLVHRERMVGNRYGDPLEMAEREEAMIKSLRQR